MEVVGLDVARVRGLYPTLSSGTAQLDGAFAALQAESVIRAIIAALRSAPAQPGSRSTRSQRTATRLARARDAVADLVAGRAEDVVLGDSLAALLWQFTARLSHDWQLGDEIVLNRLDSDLVRSTWAHTARRRGVVVRWAEVDLETGDLPSWQYEKLIGPRTRVVTVPLGNPATGMVPNVAAVAARAHRHGAVVVADAGVAPAYVLLDLAELGADVLTLSAPVFGGPTTAAVIARPGLLAETDQLRRDGDDASTLEVGPLPVELVDGLTAAVDHLAGLDEGAAGSRRERLATSIPAAGAHAGKVFDRLIHGLADLRHVAVLGGVDRDLPVVAFTVARRDPHDVGSRLQRRGVSVWVGPSGCEEVLRAYGADELGGAVFAGVMPYTSTHEVDQLLDAVRGLA